MMSALSAWQTMLSSPAPVDELSAPLGAVQVVDLLDRFWLRIACLVVFFSVVYWATPRALSAYSRGFAAMSLKDQRFFASSIAALPHHFVVIFLSSRALWTLSARGLVDARALAASAPFSLVYFAVDMIAYAIPERDAAFVAHHLVGLALAAGTLRAPVALIRWGAHFLVTEVSTPFLLIGRCLRKRGLADSRLSLLNDLIVVATFFFARVVNLTLVLFYILTAHPGDARRIGGAGLAVIVALVLLQYYWFFAKLLPSALGLRHAKLAAADKRAD